MTAVGTLDWLDRTRGRLSRREELELLATGVRSQAAILARWARSRRAQRVARLDPAAVRIPDSTAAREAEEACRELSPALAQHSHRCYLWGALLAAGDGITFDEEVLYVASLLHDTGMPVAAREGHDNCFTFDSVARARGLRAPVEPAERQRAAEEAIALHLNPAVPLSLGAEAHLLNAAAALDVTGIRYWEVDPAARATVLSRHPRHGFKAEWDGLCQLHMKAMPRGRVRWLYRYGAFGMLVKRAPFDS